MRKQKGWYNDPIRHSLASQGIKSKGILQQFHERRNDENINSRIKSIFKSVNYLHLKNIEEREGSTTHIDMDFEVSQTEYGISSSMGFDTGRNTIIGVLRLPSVENDEDDIINLINVTGAKNSTLYTPDKMDDRYRIEFRGGKNITPHLHFNFENVKYKNLDEYIEMLDNKVSNILQSEVYEL